MKRVLALFSFQRKNLMHEKGTEKGTISLKGPGTLWVRGVLVCGLVIAATADFPFDAITEMDQKSRNKNRSQNNHCQTEHPKGGERHKLLLLICNHCADCNSDSKQNQRHPNPDNKIQRDKGFLRNHRQHQTDEAEFTGIEEKFRQILEKEFVHNSELYEMPEMVSR